MTLNRQLLTAALVLTIALTGCANTPAADQNQAADSADNSTRGLTEQDVRQLLRNETGPLEEEVTEQEDQLQALQEEVARLSDRVENLSDRVRILEERHGDGSATQEDTGPRFTHVANETSHNVTLWLDEAYPRSGGCQEDVGEECWNVELNITNDRSHELDIGPRYWEVGLNDTDTRKDATASTGDEQLPRNTTKRLVLSFPVPTERVITDVYFEFQTVDGTRTLSISVP